MGKKELSHAYEDAMCHQLMYIAHHADAEEQLAGTLQVLKELASAAGLENVAAFAEQQIIELTGVELQQAT